MTFYPNCTAECAATPECTVCGKRKHPRGRSVPMAMAGGWCDWDCPGYNQPPEPGHLWPEEWREELADRAGSL